MHEETRRLGEERDRLDAKLDDYADKLVNADGGTASAQALQQAASNIETQLGGVDYLVQQFGESAEVTVKGLNAGEFARVQDRAATMRAQRDEPGDIPGARSNVFAAMGVVDAPFLDEDAATLDDRVQAVTSQPIGVSKWLESIANELTTANEGNYKSLGERLADRAD